MHVRSRFGFGKGSADWIFVGLSNRVTVYDVSGDSVREQISGYSELVPCHGTNLYKVSELAIELPLYRKSFVTFPIDVELYYNLSNDCKCVVRGCKTEVAWGFN